MSDDCTIHLEANILEKNYTTHITEYHDYSNGAHGMLRRDEVVLHVLFKSRRN